MSRKLSAHVVAILRQHPRREELSLEEVDVLGQRVLALLSVAIGILEEHSERWQSPEERALYAATWSEAARAWRDRK